MKLYATKETEEESALLTPWSFVHVLVGCAAKERGIPLGWFELAHALYELKDYMENKQGENLNTLINSVGDQASATFGHLVVKTNTNQYYWTIFYVAAWLGAVALGDRIG